MSGILTSMPAGFTRRPPRGGALARRALLVAAMFAGTSLHAQQTPPRGRIEGEVMDSVHARKLMGAIVMATRLSPEPSLFMSTVTDAKGRFSFDTLAAGRYAVAFTDALLDSLEVIMAPREVIVAEGARARVEFGTPSSATYRAAACPGLSLPSGKGAVFGSVRDADTERPLARATVAVGWTDITFDRKTLQAAVTPHTGMVTTDTLGLYRICGVPTDTPLLVQVQTDSVAGTAVELMVDDTVGVAMRALSLSVSDARSLASTAPAPSASQPPSPAPLSGTSTLAGVVRAQSGEPLAGASVRVVDAGQMAITDSAGHFELFRLPAGSQVAEVRKLGYLLGRTQVELRRGRASDITVRLTRIVSLDSVRIMARRSRYADFEMHRKNNGWGTFFDEQQIANRGAFELSDLLYTVPGIRVTGQGLSAQVVSARGIVSLTGMLCPLNVIIDGVQHMDINMLRPYDVAAIEVYPSNVGVPVQYMSSSECGAVVIWTKR